MLRKLTFFAAAIAVVAIAGGPAAGSAAAAGNAPTVVIEPIDSSDIHQEPDGTLVETRVLGVRRTVSFPDGTVVMTEEYTIDQTASLGETLIYDSSALTRSQVRFSGEQTLLYSLSSHTDMVWGDGRDCDIDVRFLVVRDQVIINEQVGPVCTAA